MTVSYDSATQTLRMNATLSRIDNHASPATLEICTASYAVVLVSIALAKPSFLVSGEPAELGLLNIPRSGVAINTGIAASGRIKDGAGNVIVNNLVVGTDGFIEIVLNSTSITSGQNVAITNGWIVHAE